MTGLVQDIRFGLRQLRKSSGFTAIAAFTLALGIGANTAIFSLISGILLRPLAYPRPVSLAGIAIGLAGAFFVTRWLASQLYGICPMDGPTFAGVAVPVAMVTMADCYLPARRAPRVDPTMALRYD